MRMKTRTVVFLLVFVATVIGTAVEFAGVTREYILPTPTVRVYDSMEMKRLPVTSETYGFSIGESPDTIESGSVLYGNVTLCCTESPSKYTPVLYILTSDQMSMWKNRNIGPVYHTAKTTTTPPLNYTFSGPQGTETLTFRIVTHSSGIYYFVVFCSVYEKAALDMNVSRIGESLIVKWALPIISTVSLIAAFIDYKRSD